MNCSSCRYAREAGNHDLLGCLYWTAIFRGEQSALRSALTYINQMENYRFNLDRAVLNADAIGFLIDILVEDYAPKPLYEGWADLDQPYHQGASGREMTNTCVVLNPNCYCRFHQYLKQSPVEIKEEMKVAQAR